MFLKIKDDFSCYQLSNLNFELEVVAMESVDNSSSNLYLVSKRKLCYIINNKKFQPLLDLSVRFLEFTNGERIWISIP